MPELPEVETVRRQLSQVIVGREIADVQVLKAKSWNGELKDVVGQKVTGIDRRSKVLLIRLANDHTLMVHLKMSGQLIFVDGEFRTGGGHPTADWIQDLPSGHTRVIFTFADGTKLFFNDQRIFGWIRLLSSEAADRSLEGLAPDVIDPLITAEYLFEKSQRRSIPIKQFIMDNQIVAGVGNIYACDALNLAKISPLRPASSIPKEKMIRLLKAMREVVELGIELGGATAHGKYVHVTGLAGKYQDKMRVYGKKGEPCPNCGAMIIKMKLGGRGTFYCPNCQK
ncbi:bifunctional DNA-formamidopyrimidine glycosylase/DNA-(apurinic or apyrimidinic site) lyase [Patescibacteria group bacterium]|nr:bifunctional DNA-formamidopyrimidine glycosylase/DNA-(apurinic or apyrimidinic site) lyase [Patescibacteria group bacterium]